MMIMMTVILQTNIVCTLYINFFFPIRHPRMLYAYINMQNLFMTRLYKKKNRIHKSVTHCLLDQSWQFASGQQVCIFFSLYIKCVCVCRYNVCSRQHGELYGYIIVGNQEAHKHTLPLQSSGKNVRQQQALIFLPNFKSIKRLKCICFE